MADTKGVNATHLVSFSHNSDKLALTTLHAQSECNGRHHPSRHPKVLHWIDSRKLLALLGTQKGSGGLHEAAICPPQQQTELATIVPLTQHPSPGFTTRRQGQDSEAP